ncbi:MAG: polysaccharide deacetylase family protein [Dehalococcoidia bacterium]
MDIIGLTATASNRLGFLDAYGFMRRKLTKSQVAILMYHRVCPHTDNWSLESLNPRSFHKQIEYLSHGYEFLRLDALVECIHQRKSLPEKAVVITFDDGYKDNYLYAYPILKKYRIPATIFLSTGYIDKSRLFWWDEIRYIINNTTAVQLDLDELGKYSLCPANRCRAGFIISDKLKDLPGGRKNVLIAKLTNICQVSIPPSLGTEFVLSWDEVGEMSNDCIAFGAHTVNHPILTNVPLEQARWEITQSKKDIEERLGKEVTAFSYPYGDFNPKIVKLVQESGFTCAFSGSPNKLVSRKDSPYGLGRIGELENFNKSKVMLCGLWGDLQGILSRSRK